MKKAAFGGGSRKSIATDILGAYPPASNSWNALSCNLHRTASGTQAWLLGRC